MLFKGEIKSNQEVYTYSFSLDMELLAPWYIDIKDNELLKDNLIDFITAGYYELLIKDLNGKTVYYSSVKSFDNLTNKIHPIELLLTLDKVNKVTLKELIFNNIDKDIRPIANNFDLILSENYNYNKGWDLYMELLEGLCSENFLIDNENSLSWYLRSDGDRFTKIWNNMELYYIPDQIEPDQDIAYLIANDLIDIYVNKEGLEKESA